MTTEDKIFINENAKDKNLKEMTLILNKYTEKQIKNYCNRNNITYKKMSKEERRKVNSKERRQKKETLVNHDYFKTWTNDMAYIYGLWCADGNLYLNTFSIKLHENDSYLLQEILNKIGSEHKLYKNGSCKLIAIASKTIAKDLIILGGKRNKSLTLKFPDIPDEILGDFIRGYFDGNGWVSLSKSKKPVISICSGSEEFLNGLLKKIREKYIGNSGGFSKRKNVFTIHFGEKDSNTLKNILYNTSSNLKLNRKYEKLNQH